MYPQVYGYKHNLLSPIVFRAHMCLGLTTWDWLTREALPRRLLILLPEETISCLQFLQG